MHTVELLNIKILNTAVERMMNQEMAELGITYTQATVIGYLIDNRNKELCQKDIERTLGLTHPTVSSILSRMEASGMIETFPMSSDHRCKRIVLTEKSAELSARIQEKYQAAKRRLFAGISPANRELMAETVKQLITNIQLD